MKWDSNIAVAIDFDGTLIDRKGCVTKGAKWAYSQFKKCGCKLILWSARTGKHLNDAEDTLLREDMVFDYINEYPLREQDGKINCDVYIDDKSTFGIIPWVLYVAQVKILTERRKQNGIQPQ